MSRSRPVASAVCGTLGVLLILKALLLGYLTRSFFNENAFSARVAESLSEPHFADFVSEQIADGVIKVKPDLIGLKPVLIGVARGLVTSPPFRVAIRRGARVMHRAIMSGTGTEIVLDVKDAGVLLESMTESHPGLAKKIPPQLSAAIGRFESLPGGAQAAKLVRLANRLRAATLVLLVLGIVLCTVSVRLASERRLALVRIGIALALVALLLAIVARFGGYAVGMLARRQENLPALAGLASAFLSGLLQWALALGCAGLVLAAASASLLERIPLTRWVEGTRAWLLGPQDLMRMRLFRGLIAAAVGVAFVSWPLASLTVAIWLGGLLVVFAGLREAFVAALHLLPTVERGTLRDSVRGAPRRGAIALVATLTVALLGGIAWWIMRPEATPLAEREVTVCNGSAALCDRRFNQVVIPTSHNSMSGANIPTWMFPNQEADIPRQLADGVRGFLIDVHYGFPIRDRVRTDLESEHAPMSKYEEVVGKEGVEAALRMRDRTSGEPTGERDVYMCHGFCELGAEKFVPVLRQVHDFLVANPGEVLVFVIQDESVAPKDIERCFRESGLLDFVYRGSVRPPWPTLREMIESDQRVVVMAENDTVGVDWYHPAFQVMQETPYGFHAPSEFSNRPNRGGTGGSLLLMNHWIETTPMPKPSNAAIVNAHDALMARLNAFKRERGSYPNLVAVDFYATGDMLQVVRELNEKPWTTRASGSRKRGRAAKGT